MKRYYPAIIVIIFSFFALSSYVPYLYGGVNPDGSYSHSIPIKIPSGTRGVQPEISLVYNSNGSNGIVGIGWAIAGVPAITRDNAYAIHYTNTDTYSGPNGRLVKVDNYYHHQEENFSRFEGQNITAQGPASWVEDMPDGTRRRYGTTADSRVYSINHPGAVRMWALHSVQDPNGNSYEIEYEQHEGQCYPRKIVYTIGSGISRYRVVEFAYNENRSDVEVSYADGSKVTTAWRLDSIIVKTNVVSILGFELLGDVVRKYRLDYNDEGTVPYSRLIRIQESGTDGGALPPVEFDYDSINDPVGYQGMSYVPSDGYVTNRGDWFGGDINGDGKNDLLHVSWLLTVSNTINSHISAGNGSYVSHNFPLGNYLAGTGRWLSGDFNGDGRTDLFHTVPGLLSNHADSFLSNGDGTFSMVRANTGNAPAVDAMRWISADINGDGRTDLVHLYWIDTSYRFDSWISRGNGVFDIRNSSLSPLLPSMVSALLFGAEESVQNAVPLRSGDFNGDGKEDLVAVWFGESPDIPVPAVFTMLSQGDGRFAVVQNQIPQSAQLDRIASNEVGRAGVQFLVGDFNGDGLSDLLLANVKQNVSIMMIGRGDGTFERTTSTTDGTGWDYGDWSIADVNGDGKSDVVHFTYSRLLPDRNRVYLWLSRGNSTFIHQSVSIPAEYPLWDGMRLTGDFTGDGKYDVISVRKALLNNKINSLTNTLGHSNLITRVRDGSGGQLQIDYSPIRTVPGAIVPEESNNPIIPNKSHRYIVTRATVHDGRGSSYFTDYEYQGARIYQEGKADSKDLLFERVTNINSTGDRAVIYFIQDDPRFKGCPSLAIEYDSGGNLLKRTESTYYDNPVTIFGTTFPRLMSVRQTNYQRGNPITSGTKEFAYDEYGNTIRVVDSAPGTETIVTNATFNVNVSSWQLRRMTESTVVSNNAQVKAQRFYYDTRGNLTSAESYLDTAGKWIAQSFAYDDNGNTTMTTDPLGHASRVEYDPDYRTYPVRSINAKGQVITTAYDFRFGLKTAETDSNGNTSRYEYDQFGRLTRSIKPGDEWSTAVVYNITGDASTQYIETRVADDSSLGYHYKRQYMDALGRVYRTVQKADSYNGASLEQAVDVEYNEKGKKRRETLPYLTGAVSEEPQYFTYDYDASDRLVRKINPDHTTESYEYENPGNNTYSETLIDRDGTRHVLIKDARGRVIRKYEPNNITLSYTYNNAGVIASVMNTDGLITTIQYDSLGRKISITDPNTGATACTYDDAGRLTETRDARGNRVTYAYDELNRITTIDHPDGTPDVAYTYDDPAVANGMGRLARINDGVSQTAFSYDEVGRPAVKTRTVDGRRFIFQMEYDRPGRLSKMTYPDGSVITRHYSDSGGLEAIRWDGHSIVKYGRFKTDEAGSASAVDNKVYRVTGDGIETEIAYDPATGRPRRIISKKDKGAGETLEDVTYAFDNIGNILSLTDNLDGSRTQTFGYDDMSRLISAQGSYGAIAYRYLNNGNLILKGNLELQYDSRHPYAVSRDSDGNIYRYDANGNMIERKGDTLAYDALNRLVSISRGGRTEVTYSYDYTNHRIKKSLRNRTDVYNIEGLYEITELRSGRERHIKYFYGIKNELVAQMTKDNAALMAFHDPKVIKRFYAGNSLKGLLLYSYEYGNYLCNNRSTLKYFLIAVLSVFFCLMLAGYLPVAARGRADRKLPGWALKSAPALCFCVFAVFGFFGCSNTINNWDEPGTPPWVVVPGSGTDEGMLFYHPDYNRNISYVTNEGGNKVYQAYYKPYGEIAETVGRDVVKYKFNTHELDAESGMYYYNARYYDSNIGRFITADTVVPNPGKSQLMNRYMYVAGNPVTMNDPDGQKPTWQWDIYAERGLAAWTQQQQIEEQKSPLVQMCKSLINSFTGIFSWMDGGWKGFLSSWVTNFINYPNFSLSYTYKEGWGVTGGYSNGNQYISGGGGFHWQERGPNKGVSIYGTVSLSYYNLSIGLTTSYNLNKHTIANNLRLSLSGEGGAIGIGYTWVNDARSGKLISSGWTAYAGINISGIVGSLPTSKVGDGRPMPIKFAQLEWDNPNGPSITKAVTGKEEEPPVLGTEGHPLTRVLDGLLVHPVAVLHDFVCTVTNLGTTNVPGMLACSVPAWAVSYSGLMYNSSYHNWEYGF